MSFTNLKKFEVTSDMTYAHDMEDILLRDADGVDHVPQLIGKPATDANKPFSRAQLARSNKRIKSQQARGVTVESVSAARADDRHLYPRFVLTGWNNVFDDEGNPVPFNLKTCEEFLEAVPDYVFDAVRLAYTTPQNFVQGANKEDLGN